MLNFSNKQLKKLIILSLFFSALSCSGKKKEKPKETAQTSYIKAYNYLKDKDYVQAAELFEKIDDEYPFSKWAPKAQTMAAYAYYKNEDHDKLLTIIEDFTRLNPSSEYIPYMTYVKGISYYNRIPSIKIAQDNTKQASFIFRELIARFPQTEYALDAKEKISYIDEHLAGAKMSIGRYEIKIGNYVGAISNFLEVTQRYRQTNQVPEALFRLGEIYYKIGLEKEANESLGELKYRFPDNKWAKMKIKES